MSATTGRPPAPYIAPVTGDIEQRLQHITDWISQNRASISLLQQQMKQVAARTNAVITEAPANPAGTASATNVMMGLAVGGPGLTLTASATRIIAMAGGQLANSANNGTSTVSMWMGTGAAPVHGAAVPGGTIKIGPDMVFDANPNTLSVPFSINGSATGLAPGTYWLDLALRATGGTASVTQVEATAFSLIDPVSPVPP